MRFPWKITGLCFVTLACTGLSRADDVKSSIDVRFQSSEATETPNFQKHVVPLFGRLGCNGRACHGSFQGRGGFRLSLFGYDFKADHAALFDKENPRVDTAKPLESLIIAKPTDADMHEGGKRYDKDSWQYHVIRKWIESGATWDDKDIQKLTKLEVQPAEVNFEKAGQTAQLKAIAIWADGSSEDVTPLCRFHTNDDQVAKIDQSGLVTANEKGDTHIVVFYDKAVIPIPVLRPMTDLVAATYPATPTPTKVDELVVEKLKKLGVVQSDLCTDSEFLRRVSLDITGTLPTADEVRQFLADQSSDKRKKKIDELLDSPAYAAWWTTKFCDFTNNNDQTLNNTGPIRGQATQDWWDWIHKRVADNTPYDQLAAGIVLGAGRQDGESFDEYCKTMSEIARRENGRNFSERKTMPYFWARNNVAGIDERTIAFAYSFMGVRIECAQCHKHPFDQWSKSDFDQFKQFFSALSRGNNNTANPADKKKYDELLAAVLPKDKEYKNNNDRQRALEQAVKDGKTIPFGEVYSTNTGKSKPSNPKNENKKNRQPVKVTTGRILGGEEQDLSTFEDPRQPVMDWLRDPKNRYFAPAFVNRVWANYFNVGIVTPTDDLNLANAPSNRPLLDYLTKQFIASGYDMKALHREITNSRTYQLSWKSNETNQLDERNFSHAVARRLPAEVTVDAVYAATVSNERANTLRTDIKGRAIAIPGSSNRQNNGGPGFALAVFGRSTRETNCDCDRSMDASLLQTVYLQNDIEIKSRLEARDSWITAATMELAKEKQAQLAKAKPGKNNTDLVALIKSLERRVERMREKKQEDQLKKAEDQLAKARADLAKQEAVIVDAKKAETAAKVIDPKVVQPLVETAYLRTLSRMPTTDELTATVQYVVDDGDLTGGLRDVMWALLNTKEFIVNH